MPHRIEDLANLGPASAKMLKAAGIHTSTQLSECGAVVAFLRVQQSGGRPSKNLLWAIEGALTGKRWDQLTQERRGQLLAELEESQRD